MAKEVLKLFMQPAAYADVIRSCACSLQHTHSLHAARNAAASTRINYMQQGMQPAAYGIFSLVFTTMMPLRVCLANFPLCVVERKTDWSECKVRSRVSKRVYLFDFQLVLLLLDNHIPDFVIKFKK